jgi:hypothetical protein
MLPLPTDNSDPIVLADWIELSAIQAADKNISANDLKKALGLMLTENDDLVQQTMLELEYRVIAAATAYPFELEKSSLVRAKANWKEYAAYLFCLCLSYFGWKIVKNAPINPWYLFEDLSLLAATQYCRGEVFRLGTRWATKTDKASFGKAVGELAIKLGEGQGFKPTKVLRPQDDSVDLVAWFDMPDGQPGKMVIFAQCASGANWPKKVTELQPDTFWKQWFLESQISPLLKSFFTPYRIPSGEKWISEVRKAGILFDRCRVAYWAHCNSKLVNADARYLTWCSTLPVIQKALGGELVTIKKPTQRSVAKKKVIRKPVVTRKSTVKLRK